MAKENKTERILLRVTKDTLEILEKLATKNNESVNGYIRSCLFYFWNWSEDMPELRTEVEALRKENEYLKFHISRLTELIQDHIKKNT